MDTSRLERISHEAATLAGEYLLKSLNQKREVSEKQGLELVSDADLQAQEIIIKKLSEAGIRITAEEGMEQTGETCWLVDPIDGSTNYIHSLPVFSISIGLKVAGEIVLGIVHAPYLNETFKAQKGKGADLNGEPISVSGTTELGDALLATGFPYDLKTARDDNFDHFRDFSLHARAIRRMGCASLDLAYVACGRFDGFWEMKLKPWDTAAGMLLVLEASGQVTGFQGESFEPGMDKVLATNGRIHEEMLKILRRGDS